VGFVVTVPMVQAQEAPSLERDRMYQRYLNFSSYLQGGSINAHWMSDGATFWYAEDRPDGGVVWNVNANRGTKAPLFDAGRLRKALVPLLGHEPTSAGLQFRDAVMLAGERALRFRVEGLDVELDLQSYVVMRSVGALVPAARGEIRSPDRRWFAGVRDHNIWIRSALDQTMTPLTTDGVMDEAWTAPPARARWSPDSRTLAVLRRDTKSVPQVPILHNLARNETVEWISYPKAGDPRGLVEMYFLDVASKLATRVHAVQEQNPTPLAWRRSGELIYMSTARYGGRLDLLVADPRTGSVRQILSEADPWPYPFRTPRDMITLLDDDERFIWMSTRDGWSHLYLYGVDGTLIRALTRGAFRIVRVVGVDEPAGWVYVTAQSDPARPYDEHFARVSLDGQRFEQLTDSPGVHQVALSPSKAFFLDTHSSVTRPPIVELRRSNGDFVQTVSTVDVATLTQALKWQAPEEFSVNAADGLTRLYGVLYKPYDFDPKRKYPVIQTFGITTAFSQNGGYEAPAMAHLGFIVVGLRGRGTQGRDKAFLNADRGHIGQFEVADQVAGLQQLAATRPFMDLTRVGVLGGSYPGFIVTRALLFAPDVYRAGVAVDAISDMAAHWQNEGMLGLPESNQAAYEYASNMRFAGNLRSKLLLIHGTDDRDVPISHTMRMIEALIEAGKPYDLVILPEQPHVASGQSWRYMLDAIRRYFQEHLRAEMSR
jgi:dipeptidyl aminopeptidase/acylaminoacyl peptidase